MEHGLRLQWPFRILMAGSYGSGKSTLTTRLGARTEETMSRIPQKILPFCNHMQQTYQYLVKSSPCSLPLLTGAVSGKPGLQWFTKKSHHYNTWLNCFRMSSTRFQSTGPSTWMPTTSFCWRTLWHITDHSPGSGKSSITKKLVACTEEIMIRVQQKILPFCSHIHQAYQNLAKIAPCSEPLLAVCENITIELTVRLLS